MKTILLLISVLMFASCKKVNNKTSAVPVMSAYEQRAFLVVPHNENISILREKLLHMRLSSMLKQTNDINIDIDDEFRFNTDHFQPTKNELREYKKLKTTSAEVIVSFPDRTEIYFVPSGLLRKQAFLDLHLRGRENLEDKQEFAWAAETPDLFAKGETYYLLSASKEELLINDQSFSFLKMESAKDVSKVFQFSRFQKIVMHFQFDYFTKETALITIDAPHGSCKRDLMEAGMCECKASLEQATGGLKKSNWGLDSFGLAFFINGKEYQAADFQPQISNDKQSLTVVVDLSKLDLSEDVSFQLLLPRVAPLKKTVSAFNYQGLCRSQGITSVLDLTPNVQMIYQLDVFGRNVKI